MPTHQEQNVKFEAPELPIRTLSKLKQSYLAIFIVFLVYVIIGIFMQQPIPPKGEFFWKGELVNLDKFKVGVHGTYYPKCHDLYNKTDAQKIYKDTPRDMLDFETVQASLHTLLVSVVTLAAGCYHSQYLFANHGTKVQQQSDQQTLQSSDAYWFPVTASAGLFGLFMLNKYLNPDLFQNLISAYVSLIAVFSFSMNIQEFLAILQGKKVMTTSPIMNVKKVFSIMGQKIDIDFSIGWLDILTILISAGFAVFYEGLKADIFGMDKLLENHLSWILNNLFGLNFCLLALKQISLSSYKTGAILLCGLFLYDIFWVFFSEGIFGANVMVTVATKINAPIKLLFFREQDRCGDFQYSMLGLGDIVVPGFFLAFLSKFDAANKSNYFEITMIWYFISILLTLGVMLTFKHAQPALLYIVPCLLIGSFSLAVYRKEVKKLISYEIPDGDEEKVKAE